LHGVRFEAAFRGFVKRSSDKRLERTVGSERGLRLVFRMMARAYRPDRAEGWSGDIRYELTDSHGAVRIWTVSCTPTGARARASPEPGPALTIKLSLADFIRLAGQDLNPAVSLLTGRMDLEGDFAVAVRLGDMFGQPSVY
jgi:putative sterol carrier protein